MLLGFLVLLVSLLCGELAASALSLPLPGAVLGMALLALLLGLRQGRLSQVEGSADALLSRMPLLFVPAGVGVMQFGDSLRASWLPLLLTLLPGTLLAVAVTALTLRGCLALQARLARAERQ